MTSILARLQLPRNCLTQSISYTFMYVHRSELGTLPHLPRRADGRLAVGAARALGITQPTAGRHVAALEAAFGQTLFTRSPSGLLPTEAALALRGHAEALRSAAAAFERAAASHGAGVRGIVRISASDVIAVEVLPPMLAQLRRNHPKPSSNWCRPTASRTCSSARPTSRSGWRRPRRRPWLRGVSARSMSGCMRATITWRTTACPRRPTHSRITR